MIMLWKRSGARPRVRPLAAWFWMLLAAAAAGAAIWSVSWWLLGVASKAPAGAPRVSAQIDAVRTGLAAGAGAGAAVGLMLAFRRQRHPEIATALSDYDAGERRITDLYIRAADQLGSDKAPVRLAGLYALERLAQDNPGHRQTIVNLICAYLRMPYTAPADVNLAVYRDQHRHQVRYQSARRGLTAQELKPADTREEHQVRLTAQRVLATHLHSDDATRFWHNINLDLTGAHLIDLDMTNCSIVTGTFRGASFTGGVFRGAAFTEADFGEATFSAPDFRDATFADATFTGHTNFRNATFSSDADFSGATFSHAHFDGATFSGAYFSDAIFTGAYFNNATFSEDAVFRGATFTSAHFDSATFTGDADFSNARFSDATSTRKDGFRGPIIIGAYFNNATFSSNANFSSATFTSADFDGAIFTGVTDFSSATFSDVSFGITDPSGDTTARALDIALNHIWPKGWGVKPAEGSAGRLTRITSA